MALPTQRIQECTRLGSPSWVLVIFEFPALGMLDLLWPGNICCSLNFIFEMLLTTASPDTMK